MRNLFLEFDRYDDYTFAQATLGLLVVGPSSTKMATAKFTEKQMSLKEKKKDPTTILVSFVLFCFVYGRFVVVDLEMLGF